MLGIICQNSWGEWVYIFFELNQFANHYLRAIVFYISEINNIGCLLLFKEQGVPFL